MEPKLPTYIFIVCLFPLTPFLIPRQNYMATIIVVTTLLDSTLLEHFTGSPDVKSPDVQ